MPWVVRDVVDEINRAVGRRWQGLDRLLPSRAELPEGGAETQAALAVRPLSAPFRGRTGYRPLGTGWEVRPAASLR